MLSALALSLMVGALPPERLLVAVLEIDNRGAKIPYASLSNMGEVTTTILLATGVLEVITPQHLLARVEAVAAVRACAGSSCAPSVATALGADDVLITRVLAVGKVCAVSATWWNLKDNVTEGAAVREGSCAEEAVLASLRAVVEQASEQGVVAYRLRQQIARRDRCEVDADAPAGYLTLDTTPTARARIGDRVLGETPLSKTRLPSGCVEVTVETLDGAIERTFRVAIEPNRTVRYRASLTAPKEL